MGWSGFLAKVHTFCVILFAAGELQRTREARELMLASDLTSACERAAMLRIVCITTVYAVASGFVTNTSPGNKLLLRQHKMCSISMMKMSNSQDENKRIGAKLDVKSGDFDISNPIKPVCLEPPKDTSEAIPPPVIKTECGADYGPLLAALQQGKWEEADQLTRDMLIWIGGEETRSRNWVYYAEVKILPMKDMKTIDDLWTAYSKGMFGYSVQKKIWLSKKVKGDFNKFVSEIDWNKGPGVSGDTGILRREI